MAADSVEEEILLLYSEGESLYLASSVLCRTCVVDGNINLFSIVS